MFEEADACNVLGLSFAGLCSRTVCNAYESVIHESIRLIVIVLMYVVLCIILKLNQIDSIDMIINNNSTNCWLTPTTMAAFSLSLVSVENGRELLLGGPSEYMIGRGPLVKVGE